jgi:hypothetical protein
MDATVIGVPLANLSLEQLHRLRDLVNAEIARRQAPPPDVPGPMFGGVISQGRDNAPGPPAG